MEKVDLFSKIERVIFNNPATIILFNDGTKSVAKCDGVDKYDPFKGYLTALIKHILPKKYNLINLIYCGIDNDLCFGYNLPHEDDHTSLYKKHNDQFDVKCDVVYSKHDQYTRRLLCLLHYFSKEYYKYKNVYIDEMDKLLSSKPKFYSNPKNHASVDFYNVPDSFLFDNHILNLSIDEHNIMRNPIFPQNNIHIDGNNNPNIYFDNVDISKVIKETLDDYFKKQTYTVMLDTDSKYLAQMVNDHNAACGHDIRTMYPHSLIHGMMSMDDFIKKVGENMSRGFEEGLSSRIKINYDMFKIDHSKGHVYNANIYETFLGRFNSTSEWTENECLQHGLLGLMSELGELKEVLTEMFYTSDCSGDMFTHLHREMSDVCWMLCEYTSYSDFDLGPCPFSIYIENSIDFHNSNNTKYLNWYQPLPANNPFGVAIDVVDTMMMDVSKICNIYQKILQGHIFREFVEEHNDILFDIYVNLQYISQYIFDTNFTTLFDISMKKVKNRYPDGWMDPQRSINRKPEDI